MNAPAPFHVLLTNDDGHAAPGIQILRDALKRHGYRVTMVAPSGEQSAMSMSTRFLLKQRAFYNLGHPCFFVFPTSVT